MVILDEFTPENHERAACGQPRNCRQNTTVSKYIHQFRHVVFVVSDLSERDKWNKFVEGFKHAIACKV